MAPGHHRRGRRPVLQPAGAAEVPQVGRGRDHAGVAHGDAAGAGVPGGRLHADERAAACSCGARRPRRLEDRFYQLYGERPDLVPVAKEAGGLRIRGYVAALAEQGPTRGAQQFFVNGRIVKDRTIAHAVIDAYAAATARERSPEAHLFIEMPPDAVDVNVHPTKAEVRFRHQSLVHEVVRRAVQDAHRRRRRARSCRLAPPGWSATPARSTSGCRACCPAGSPQRRWSAQGQADAGRDARRAAAARWPACPGPAAVPGACPAGSLAEIALKPLIPLGQFREHVHHRGGRRRRGHHRPARGARAGAVRAHLGAADRRRAREPAPADADRHGDAARGAAARCSPHGDELRRCGFEVEEFGADQRAR